MGGLEGSLGADGDCEDGCLDLLSLLNGCCMNYEAYDGYSSMLHRSCSVSYNDFRVGIYIDKRGIF